MAQDLDFDDNATTLSTVVNTPTTSRDPSVDSWKPLTEQALNFTAVPYRDTVYVLRSASCKRLLKTLSDGEVVLTHPNTPIDDLMRWECIETSFYLGFRNVATRKFLGHGGWSDTLRCSQPAHNWWEMFQVRAQPHGGHVLLLDHWGSAWPVGLYVDAGRERLVKADLVRSTLVVWEFAIVNGAGNDEGLA